MDELVKQERKREAQRRLRDQRRRAGQLRGRVVMISLVAFVLLWGIVFAQMATGNDPVLGNRSRASAPPHRASAGGRGQGVEPSETEPEPREPVEAEVIEVEPPPEAVESEAEVEVVEPEPAPVTTGQS